MVINTEGIFLYLSIYHREIKEEQEWENSIDARLLVNLNLTKEK